MRFLLKIFILNDHFARFFFPFFVAVVAEHNDVKTVRYKEFFLLMLFRTNKQIKYYIYFKKRKMLGNDYNDLDFDEQDNEQDNYFQVEILFYS